MRVPETARPIVRGHQTPSFLRALRVLRASPSPPAAFDKKGPCWVRYANISNANRRWLAQTQGEIWKKKCSHGGHGGHGGLERILELWMGCGEWHGLKPASRD
jgi:hypothetical protein